MFGKKQEYTKELQERITKAESELESFQEKMKQAAGSVQQMLPCFESQIIAQSEMDKDLTKIVGYTHNTMEENHENGQALEQLAIEFTNVRSLLQEDEAERNKISESVHKQAAQAQAAVEKYKQCADLSGQVQKTGEQLTASMEHMQNRLTQMVDFSKDMGVLSLNCAIEAGRMGESGRRFIAAAEDVRQMSSAYEQAAQSALDQLAEMEGRLRELEKQALSLTKGLADGQSGMTQLSKAIANQEELCANATKRAVPKKMATLTDCLKRMSQSQHAIGVLQQQTLDEMEHIGKSFMEEQEARKELEEIASQVSSQFH